MEPTVSVIIPCYNQAHFLKESLASVMAQTWQDFEIIVVDDGSTNPETLHILDNFQHPRATLVRQENRGLAGARNTGIRHARGKYIMPLDSDDKIAASYLEKAVAILEARPEVGIVYANARFFGAREDVWHLPEFVLEDFLFNNCIFCSALYRRSDWARAGGYDENLRSWEDFELWLAFLELGLQVYKIPEELFYYRQHAESMLNSLGVRERYEKSVTLLAYMMNKHEALYREHCEAVARRILPAPVPPRHAGVRYAKYSILRHVYGLLAIIPGMSAWAKAKAAKSRRELDRLKPE